MTQYLEMMMMIMMIMSYRVTSLDRGDPVPGEDGPGQHHSDEGGGLDQGQQGDQRQVRAGNRR